MDYQVGWLPTGTLLSGKNLDVNLFGVAVVPEMSGAGPVDGRRSHVCPEAAEPNILPLGMNLPSTDKIPFDEVGPHYQLQSSIFFVALFRYTVPTCAGVHQWICNDIPRLDSSFEPATVWDVVETKVFDLPIFQVCYVL